MLINSANAPKLSVRETAELLQVSKSWLNKSRLVGCGPPYLKLGRRVLYDVADIEGWLVTKKRSNTSQLP
jgi:predicted DNA-binding transcriptional regulator AlpA